MSEILKNEDLILKNLGTFKLIKKIQNREKSKNKKGIYYKRETFDKFFSIK